MTARSLCHEDWDDTRTPAGLGAGDAGLMRKPVAVPLQFTNAWPVERRRATMAAIRARAGLS